MIGINWSGPRLVGWSFTPAEVLNRLAADGFVRGTMPEALTLDLGAADA